jgi:hypothetical protein
MDGGPGPELKDTDRSKLMDELDGLLVGRQITGVPVSMRAGLWLSDLDVLRATVEKVKNNDPGMNYQFTHRTLVINAIIKPCQLSLR